MKRVHPKHIELKLIEIMKEAENSPSSCRESSFSPFVKRKEDSSNVRRKGSTCSSSTSSSSFASSSSSFSSSDFSDDPSSCHFQNRILDNLTISEEQVSSSPSYNNSNDRNLRSVCHYTTVSNFRPDPAKTFCPLISPEEELKLRRGIRRKSPGRNSSPSVGSGGKSWGGPDELNLAT